MRRRTGFEPAEVSAAKFFADKDSRPAIDVRIDELLVHGIDVADRFRIADAVKGELTRILSEQGLPARWRTSGSRDRLTGGDFSLARITRGEMIGSQIAQAVYRGFSEVESSGRNGPANPANNGTTAKQ